MHVVREALTERPYLKALFWDFLESIPGTEVRRADPTTWMNKKDWLPSPGNGIISGFGFNHCAFMWRLRLLPKVRRAFEVVWDDETDLDFDEFERWRESQIVDFSFKFRGWREDGADAAADPPQVVSVSIDETPTFSNEAQVQDGHWHVPVPRPEGQEDLHPNEWLCIACSDTGGLEG